MMRLWANSYARSAVGLAVASAVLSTVLHTGIIAAWIYATLPAEGVPDGSLANKTYPPAYVPPPDRSPGARGGHGETVHYIDMTREGPGVGDGPRVMGNARPVAATEDVGRAPVDTAVTQVGSPAVGTQDSVFSVLDVDTAVVRSANSAAPAYPLKLLTAHVMGYVAARYTVDTTGFADTSSFVVMRSTNPEFVDAVREALPYMRFRPAKIGPTKVRQLVEQTFTFRITQPAVPDAKKPAP